MVSLKKAYLKTYQLAKGNPVLFLPFAAFAAFEFVSLIILYLAPRMPLKLLFGPPIRSLWGERFLHYPANFILLPKLASLARVCLTVVIGSLLTGIATLLVYNLYKKNKPVIKEVFKTVLKQYLSLFCIVLLFTLIFYGLDKITSKLLIKYFTSGHTNLLFLGAKFWLGLGLMTLNFTAAVLIQSAFVYAIPVLIIEKATLTKAILKSFGLFKKLFLKTVALVLFPMLIYIPVIVIQYDPAFLITRLFPEAVLLASILSLIVSSLVVDLTITVTAANLYLMNKNE
ncbi:MAG: hypothetical protein PHR84_06475 [Candidatus Omnitrophica bacterium]|nr:hypothetical protein [Candidatus Omnitrophota bacterium]MDD5661481.1 hypothetical protein [Candidatus Omnitrophota bacterium]